MSFSTKTKPLFKQKYSKVDTVPLSKKCPASKTLNLTHQNTVFQNICVGELFVIIFFQTVILMKEFYCFSNNTQTALLKLFKMQVVFEALKTVKNIYLKMVSVIYLSQYISLLLTVLSEVGEKVGKYTVWK